MLSTDLTVIAERLESVHMRSIGRVPGPVLIELQKAITSILNTAGDVERLEARAAATTTIPHEGQVS